MKGGGVKNDNSRHPNVSDAGQNQAIRSNADTPKKTQLTGNSANSNGECADVLQHETNKSKEIENFMSSLNESEEKQAIHFLVEQRQWVGLLPDPATFSQYPQKVQESILSWNNATILDGSERETKMVDSFIRHRKWAQIFSFLINMGTPIAGMVAFVMTGEHACLTSIGVPVISIGVNVWKDKQEEKDKNKD